MQLNREMMNHLEMLQWISERNEAIPISELAFLLDIPEDEYAADVLTLDERHTYHL